MMKTARKSPGSVVPARAFADIFQFFFTRRGQKMEYRIEHDSMGEVRVPADKYWAVQTERSRGNFPIGVGIETMPKEIIRAFGKTYLSLSISISN